MGSKSVNTVSGAVSPDDLGITLMHEHLVFGYPGWYGDCSIAPFDRDLALTTALDLMEQLKDCGLKTYVDATPNETGRNPELYREIAEKSGVNIVCSTGFYTENSGASAYFKFRNLVQDGIEQIYEMFMREITVGIGDTGIKAGVIKLASSKDVITDYERMFFVAAARAQKETGVPIITHTQEASMGPEQAQLLIDEGADPKQVMIGHMSDNTDVHYHLEVLNKGVYDAFDRMGLQVLEGCPLDIERYAVVTGLIAIGHIDRIIISHDYIAYMLGRSLPEPPEPFKELLANYHPTHLFKNIVPFLKSAGISDEQVNTILVDNPRRLFAGE